eukprot:RCo042059
MASSSDELWGHRWGFRDSRFAFTPSGEVTFTGKRYGISGTTMPHFITYVEDCLQVRLDRAGSLNPCEKPHFRAAPPVQNPAFVSAVSAAFRAAQYTQEDSQRILHSHGQTTVDEVYCVFYADLERVCDLVFFPEREEDVTTMIRLAVKHDVCLVPYGGGTSVSCALLLPPHEKRLITVLDLRRMDKVLSVDPVNFTAVVQAGITGRVLEEELGRQGFTAGHEPDSVEMSTLGGWIATNASGMKKNRYGNIEDIVLGFTLATPSGIIDTLASFPRVSAGMQPYKLLFGNEGTMGVVTKATLRVHPKPQVKNYGSLVFRDFSTGVKFLYDLSKSGVLPASVRLMDNFQFRFGAALRPKTGFWGNLLHWLVKFFLYRVYRFDPMKVSAATLVLEGSKESVRMQWKAIMPLARKHGGVYGGEGNGRRGYYLTFAIAYIRDFFFDMGVTGETYETTAPWDKAEAVIEAVKRKGEELHYANGFPGRPWVCARITQLYHTGVCIYFTHAFGFLGMKRPDLIFKQMEEEIRGVIMAAGGSISHHHGVGKLRQGFMKEVLTPDSIQLLRQMKAAQDQKNVFGIRNNVFAE